MTRKEREIYKKKLLKKKEEIIHKISEAHSETKEVEAGIAQDVVDKAESSYTKEFLFSLSDSERRQLFLIDDALRRIEKGEYGLCQMCHREIGKKRLEVVPWAPFCIECQEKEEQREAG